MAPRWGAFLALAALVLVLLLALARLSQGALGEYDGDATTPVDRPGAGSDAASEAADGDVEPGLHEPVTIDATDDPSHPRSADGTPHSRPAISTPALLANVAVTQGLLAGVLTAGAWWTGIPAGAFGLAPGPWTRGLPAFVVGAGFGVALWAASESGARIADALGHRHDESLRALLAPDSGPGWAVLLALVLPTIAVAEELLFRGALIGVVGTASGVSPWILAVASSVAFALGHGAQGRAGVVVTGVLGLVLAAGFVLTGSLLVVIVAHYVVNAMEFVVHEGLGAHRAGS